MPTVKAPATSRYDAAAPRWGDKMRTLGYFDEYIRMLSTQRQRSSQRSRVVDIGSGTAAFAEAWIAVNGPPDGVTLLDPSRAMLERGRNSVRARGVEPKLVQAMLGETELEPVDEALAAHVLEHCPDPSTALGHIRDALMPGGRLHLVVSKPHWCNAVIWLQWRHRTFGREEILGLVAGAGFSVEGLYTFASGPPSRTSIGVFATRKD